MRNEKTGFYNSALQRELGLRLKKPRKPYVRNVYVAAALSRGFTLEHTETLETVIIEPFECPNIVFVINKLMLHPQLEQRRENWNRFPNKKKHFAVSALTRILTGHIDQRTGKSLYSFMGWRVLGINSFIE